MSLNIKNERVHALAREAARRTGHSQTSVIEEALAAYLAGLDRAEEPRRDRVDRLLADFRVRLGGRPLSTEHLYDDAGMPR